VSSILRLSYPLKKQYAIEHNLDLDRLLDATAYKEACRADMIRWGEEKRRQDPGYFIRAVAESPGSEKSVWIISDARRQSDIRYLRDQYSTDRVVLVRVEASQLTRTSRGWTFAPGIDDAESECDLDLMDFDVHIMNDGDSNLLDDQMSNLTLYIKNKLSAVKT